MEGFWGEKKNRKAKVKERMDNGGKCQMEKTREWWEEKARLANQREKRGGTTREEKVRSEKSAGTNRRSMILC